MLGQVLDYEGIPEIDLCGMEYAGYCLPGHNGESGLYIEFVQYINCLPLYQDGTTATASYPAALTVFLISLYVQCISVFQNPSLTTISL